MIVGFSLYLFLSLSLSQVRGAFTERKDQHTSWWLDALYHIEQNKDSSSALIQKIEESLSRNLNKKSRTSAWLVMVQLWF